jgi:hypothetical protein
MPRRHCPGFSQGNRTAKRETNPKGRRTLVPKWQRHAEQVNQEPENREGLHGRLPCQLYAFGLLDPQSRLPLSGWQGTTQQESRRWHLVTSFGWHVCNRVLGALASLFSDPLSKDLLASGCGLSSILRDFHAFCSGIGPQAGPGCSPGSRHSVIRCRCWQRGAFIRFVSKGSKSAAVNRRTRPFLLFMWWGA